MNRFLSCILALLTLLSCDKHESLHQQNDVLHYGRSVFSVEDMILTDGQWIDFHKKQVFSAEEFSALDQQARQEVDMGYCEGRFVNHSTKVYKTRFHLATITPEAYSAIKTHDDLMDHVDEVNWSNVPMSLDEISSACVAFKTYLPEESNCYGIMLISELSSESVRFSFKFCDTSYNPDYNQPRKVTISNGRMYVDGHEFYVKGAAATMCYSHMAKYGANVCRIYSASKQTRGILDELYESGLMCYVGLPAKAYSSFSPGEPTYDDPTYRAAAIASVMQIVEYLKDHPAVLCWSLGNELEIYGNAAREGYYKYYGELADALHKVDPDHPVTAAFTDIPSAFKLSMIKEHCPNLDFLSFNSYYNVLKKHAASSAQPYTQVLQENGWSKPYMITEFGPTGTWVRDDEELKTRINEWGALIQLTSDQAAEKYIECAKLIRNYRNCLGGFAFLWGYQTHGQVLGWYPFFTKDLLPLTAVEAMESYWKGISYSPRSPHIADWASAVELNGKNLAAPSMSSTGQSEKNPVLYAGQKCTAKVNASSRSGSQSSLRYKWFIYKDCTYTDESGSLTWTDSESAYSIYGDHRSMNEDARSELFINRTLSEVSFTAPLEPGNYRLYVIVTDVSVKKAASACLNFYVMK